MDGVVASSVGYTGGPAASAHPTYRSVCSGDGHTEAIRLLYDPKVLSYEQLMQKVLAEASAPSHRAKRQYMSAVWAQNAAQAAAASRVAASLNKQTVPILSSTDTIWCDAEEYHQKYVEKSQGRAACARARPPAAASLSAILTAHASL